MVAQHSMSSVRERRWLNGRTLASAVNAPLVSCISEIGIGNRGTVENGAIDGSADKGCAGQICATEVASLKIAMQEARAA